MIRQSLEAILVRPEKGTQVKFKRRYTQADLPELRTSLADLRREVARRQRDAQGLTGIFLERENKRIAEARDDAAKVEGIIAKVSGRTQRH